MLVARDHNNRIRVNRHSSRSNRQRGTTSLRAGYNSRVNIMLNVVVDSTRSIIDGGSRSTRHQDTIAVPSVNFTLNVAVGRSGRDDQLSTVTNIVEIVSNSNRSDNRIRIHRNSERFGFSLTLRGELEDLNIVFVSNSLSDGLSLRNNSVAQRGSTRNRLTIVKPLEGKLVSIPVVQVERHRNLTTNTDVVLGNGSVDDRVGVHRNLSLAGSGASILIDDLHGEAVRIVSVRPAERKRILSSGSEDSIVLKPLVLDSSSRSGFNVSVENHIVLTLSTNDRIGNQFDGRVRIHREGVHSLDVGSTTGSGLGNLNSVSVLSGLIVLSAHHLNEGSGNSALDDLTVTVPGVNLTTGNATIDVGSQFNLITVANSVLNRNVVADARHNRISVNCNIDHVGSSLTLRGELQNLNMVSVSTNGRNNRVAQLGSTSDRIITVKPLESELISIPVSQSSSESDLTTVTDVGLGSGDVHHRSSVHIDNCIVMGNTTVGVHELNAEVVRIVSVRFGEVVDGIVGDFNHRVVFHPLILNRGSRHRGDMSLELHIVHTLSTHDRIGDELDGRVRVHRDGRNEREEFRLTTGSGLLNFHSVGINRGFAVDGHRSLVQDIAVEAFDDLTVAVPSVNLTAGNTAVGHTSHDVEGSAFANGGDIEIEVFSLNNRNLVHIDTDGVVSHTVLRVEVHQVRNLHNVVGSAKSGLEGLDLVGSSGQDVRVVHLILIPLEGQHRIVVVIEVSLQRNITAFANLRSVSRDVRVRSLINIDIERIGNGRTTVAVGDFNREDVRILVGGNPALTIVVVVARRIGSVLTALVPSVGSVEVNHAIHPSGEDDVLHGRTVVTHVRVTVDGDDRVTSHEDSIRSHGNRIASGDIVHDVGFIDIVHRIVVVDVSLCTELRTMDGLQFHAIHLPHVSVVVVNVVSGLTVDKNRVAIGIQSLNVSLNLNLSTFTNVSGREFRVSIDSDDVVDSLRDDDRNLDRLTGSRTTGGRLRNNDSVLGGHARNVMQDTGSTVVDVSPFRPSFILSIVGSHLPLSGQVVHIPVAEVSSSGDLTVSANGIIINRSDNFGIFTNIDIVRFALNIATSSVADDNREDVRIILSGQREADISALTIENPNRSALHVSREVGQRHFVTNVHIPRIRDINLVTTNGVVVESPLIGVIEGRNRIVQVSIEDNEIVVTDDRVTRNLNGGLHHNVHSSFRQRSEINRDSRVNMNESFTRIIIKRIIQKPYSITV